MAATTDPRRISTFLEAIAAENGAARNTLLAYGRDLGHAAEYAIETTAEKVVEALAARADVLAAD